MLATKDMLVVESLDAEATPTSSNVDQEINPADRYSQLGDSATSAVLDSTVQRLPVSERTAVLVLDCGPKTGDWARSTMRMMNSPTIHYMAVGD